MPSPRFARYDVLGRLASGGMADVWLARARGFAGFEKLVVLKTILPRLADDPHFVNMFADEARVAAMLNHPNCVQIFELGKEDDGTVYIAMEYIEGFSLSRLLKQATAMMVRVPPDVLTRVGCDALAGLEHAHRLADREGRPMKMIHRDVSPDNLLLSFTGQTKLVDFGIAKAELRTHRATRAGTVKGKAGYIAPESLKGAPIDERADLFAMGVVLYRALTGRRPFSGRTEAEVSLAVVTVIPPPPHTLAPDVSAALSAVVMRALEKSPADRFQSAREMRLALEAALKPAHTDTVAVLLGTLWPPGAPDRAALLGLASGKTEETSGPLLDSVVSQNVELPEGALSTPHPPGAVTESSDPSAAGPAEAATGRAMPAHVPELPPEPPTVLVRPSRPDLMPNAMPAHAPEPPTVPARPSRPDLMQTVLAAPNPVLLEAARPSRPELMATVNVPPSAALLRAVAEGTRGPKTTEIGPAQVARAVPGEAPEDSGEQVRPRRPIAVAVGLAVAVTVVAALGYAARRKGAVVAPPIVLHGRVEIDVGESVMVIEGERELGRSPGPIELLGGPHTLRLVDRSLGIDQTFPVTVRVGETVRLAEKLAVATLTVRSVPWGFVKLDGKPIGMTPIKTRQVYAGLHVIDVYNSEIEKGKHVEVVMKAGEARVVQVRLLE